MSREIDFENTIKNTLESIKDLLIVKANGLNATLEQVKAKYIVSKEMEDYYNSL